MEEAKGARDRDRVPFPVFGEQAQSLSSGSGCQIQKVSQGIIRWSVT